MSSSNVAIPIQNLESVLQESLGSHIKIENLNWKNLISIGENYGSMILAIDLEIKENGKSETLHLVAKSPPKSEFFRLVFNTPVTFYKELYFYKTIYPELLKFQIENGFKNEELFNLVPQFYGGRLGLEDPEKFDDQATIVLENLKVQGYTTEDRITGMDKKHMVFAIKQLAKLHAVSICYKIKKPQDFKELILPALKCYMNEYIRNHNRNMINKVKKLFQSMEEIKPYLEKIATTLQYGAEKLGNVPEEPWATLIHGDFWVNNMIFLYDKSGKIKDMKLLDFQATEYETGCQDLVFLIMSSAKPKVIDEDLDDMIDLYYSSFINWLKIFDVDVNEFSRAQFDKNFVESARRKLEQCLIMVIPIKATRKSVKPIEDTKAEEEVFNSDLGKEYCAKFLHLVKTYERKDWFVR